VRFTSRKREIHGQFTPMNFYTILTHSACPNTFSLRRAHSRHSILLCLERRI
jgi:hypothetical protein